MLIILDSLLLELSPPRISHDVLHRFYARVSRNVERDAERKSGFFDVNRKKRGSNTHWKIRRSDTWILEASIDSWLCGVRASFSPIFTSDMVARFLPLPLCCIAIENRDLFPRGDSATSIIASFGYEAADRLIVSFKWMWLKKRLRALLCNMAAHWWI